MRDGGDPGLTRSETNLIVGCVAENDLIFIGEFCLSSLDDGAVLENDSGTRTSRIDTFVIVVTHSVFIDNHGDDDTGCELDRFATTNVSIGLSEIGWAFVGGMWGAIGVIAEIIICFGIVFVDGIVGRYCAKVDFDRSD